MKRSSTLVSILTVLVLAAGAPACSNPVTVGGNTPITVERLTGGALTDIRTGLSWTFAPSRVVIENAGAPLPSDIVDAVLGAASERAACGRIEATWRYEGVELVLTKIVADESAIAGRVARLPLEPAGHIRANLGDRQYDVESNPDWK